MQLVGSVIQKVAAAESFYDRNSAIILPSTVFEPREGKPFTYFL